MPTNSSPTVYGLRPLSSFSPAELDEYLGTNAEPVDDVRDALQYATLGAGLPSASLLYRRLVHNHCTGPTLEHPLA